MKIILSTLSVVALTLVGCNLKREITTPVTTPTLGSPAFKASKYSFPFVGVLEMYACKVSTDLYAGNYVGEPPILKTQPAVYFIGIDGIIQSSPALKQPLGSYTLLYWGVPYNEDTTYDAPQVVNPALSIGAGLGNQTLALRKQGRDSTYSPTFDYVYALRDIEIGRDSIDVSLRRVVAGIRIVAHNANGEPLSSAITSITAQVGAVSSAINFFTASPQGAPVTVAFPLTISKDRVTAFNLTAMTFPSNPNPALTIIINLSDGTQQILRTRLSNTLTANNRLTVDVNLNEIQNAPGGGGGFQVSRWTETSEQITL